MNRPHFSARGKAGVEERENEVAKSPEDERNYRCLELTNGLKVLLVSDPLSEKAAVSLDIRVGKVSAWLGLFRFVSDRYVHTVGLNRDAQTPTQTKLNLPAVFKVTLVIKVTPLTLDFLMLFMPGRIIIAYVRNQGGIPVH